MVAANKSIPSPAPTRERLVAAMLDALQRKGLHGIGLNELLETAQAPKGVLYHHFPQGKAELAVAAIEDATARVAVSLDAMLASHKEIVASLRCWLGGAQKQLEGSHFERGCPLAAIALESGTEDAAIRAALNQAFVTVRDRLGAGLRAAGLTPVRSRQVAALLVAGYEGALIQARVAGDTRPMGDITEALVRLVQFELQQAGTRP